MSLEKTCFIIMPFSETKSHSEQYWTNHFEYFLKPFVEKELKMDIRRSKALVGDIFNSIIKDLTDSPIVIADITDFNPNVMWELGVRHSFIKSGTIIIAEKGTKIPFDLVQESILFYPDNNVNNPETGEFLKDLEKSIEKCLFKPNQYDSPVFVAISGRGTLYEIIVRDETLRKIDAVLMELENNLDNIRIAYENIQSLKNWKESVTLYSKVLVVELRVSALENLNINQYLTESRDFYERCRMCVIWIISFMDKQKKAEGLEILKQEKWIKNHGPTLERQIEDLIEELKSIRKKWETIR